MIGCSVRVAGEEVPDTAAALLVGLPTALADVEVTWGRSTSVDQPQAASARIVIRDESGGPGFVERVPIGAVLEVFARGDVATGDPMDVAVDGDFEGIAVGDPGDRVHTTSGTSTILDDGPPQGHVLHLGRAAGAVVALPPDSFSSNPSAWDAIPSFTGGQVWSWSLRVRPGMGTNVSVQPVTFAGPTVPAPSGLVGPAQIVLGTGEWRTVTGQVTSTVGNLPEWLGLRVTISGYEAWNETPGTWEEHPEPWTAHAVAVDIDDLVIESPANGLFVDVLVFSGRVTDLTATPEGTGHRVEVVAVDVLAELANREVGSEPWLAETVGARVDHIIAAAGLVGEVETLIDDPLDDLEVSWRDVDAQSVAELLVGLTSGIDGVLWVAVHATTGPYIWIENPSNRAQLGQLVEVDGEVVIVMNPDPNRIAGRTLLDGCDLPSDDATWRRDVSDVVTRVDVTWLEQTLNDDGLPAPTERNERAENTEAIAEYGVRRFGLSTPLTSAGDAIDTADRVLARSRQPEWRADGLVLDLAQFPRQPGWETRQALDLLDGTVRLGRGLIIDDVQMWPGFAPGATVVVYLDGGRYAFADDGWRLGLNTTPPSGLGKGGPWNSMTPTWTWAMMDLGIAWVDLWGVTGPELVGSST